MKQQSLTWGVLPEFPAFKAHVEAARDDDGNPVIGPPGNVYHMTLSSADSVSAKAALKALFAAGSRVAFEQFEGRNGRFGLRFFDLVSLHKFILALLTVDEMEAEADPEAERQETPGDLASSIMGQLGYEWI